MAKLIFGVGINDADYVVQPTCADGSRLVCPFYRAWMNMMKRCYSKPYHASRPTYAGCSVHSDWFVFSNFKSWMEKQDWQGNHLDKDLLVHGNKIYSKDFCVFISQELNSFFNERLGAKSLFMVGVHLSKCGKKFKSQCRDPFTKKEVYLGRFETEIEGHLAWKSKKREHANRLADMQNDERIASALRSRYA